MKKIKSFHEFVIYLNESEIVRTKNSHVGAKKSGILTISRSTRRCLVVQDSATNKWGTLQGEIEHDSSMISELKHEAMHNFKHFTGFEDGVELVTSFVFHSSDNISYHNFIALVDKEFDVSTEILHKWLTLEELLELDPKEADLEALVKNDNSFFKYLKTL